MWFIFGGREALMGGSYLPYLYINVVNPVGVSAIDADDKRIDIVAIAAAVNDEFVMDDGGIIGDRIGAVGVINIHIVRACKIRYSR